MPSLAFLSMHETVLGSADRVCTLPAGAGSSIWSFLQMACLQRSTENVTSCFMTSKSQQITEPLSSLFITICSGADKKGQFKKCYRLFSFFYSNRVMLYT